MVPNRSSLYVLIATLHLLSACSLAQKGEPTPKPVITAGEVAPSRGGVVTIGIAQEPRTLNPLLASQPVEGILSAFMVEGLVGMDAQGNYVPVLATSLPTISAPSQTITYTLQSQVRFSNGDLFTCEDVRFTWQAALAILPPERSTGYQAIAWVGCPDESTAVVHFARQTAAYLELFSFIFPHTAGSLQSVEAWTYNHRPVGTGPWVVQEWLPGDHLTLSRNPYYRLKDRPYLDRLVLKVLPSLEAGLQMLDRGEITVLWNLTESDLPTLEEMKGVGYASAPYGSGENELLLFNLADPQIDAPTDAEEFPHLILHDLRLRQAMHLGIDRQRLAAELPGGQHTPGNTVLPAGPFACPQPIKPYDPQQARTLLEQAGWHPGSDGIRQKDGQRLSLQLTMPAADPEHERTGQLLSEMMRSIGIELRLDREPSELFFAGWEENGLRKHGKFDLLLYTSGPPTDPGEYLYRNFHSASIPTRYTGGEGSNFSRYTSQEVDRLIEEAAGSMDLSTRRVLYCQVAAQINQDLPRLFLYERQVLSGYRLELQNFRISPGPADFTLGSQDWWLDASK